MVKTYEWSKSCGKSLRNPEAQRASARAGEAESEELFKRDRRRRTSVRRRRSDCTKLSCRAETMSYAYL